MKKHTVVIDGEKCIGCKMCQKDCVGAAIDIVEGKAVCSGQSCISCGHCEAICPQNAIKLTGFEEEPVEIKEQTRLNPEELLMAIRTRRTIRQFVDKEVSAEIIDNIIEAGRLAPTGGNAQNTGFIILGSKQNEAQAIAVDMFSKLMNVGKRVITPLKKMNIDDNFFFKKAPLVIVITGNSVNASLAAENMAFLAESYGLGVLFSGFFTVCANRSKKLRKLLKMEGKEKAVTTLVIGYPAVKYHRTVRREAAKVRSL